MARKVLQIIPALNVQARFNEQDGDVLYHVYCWALVEDIDPDDGTAYQWVVGMTAIDGDPKLTEADAGEADGRFVNYLTNTNAHDKP